MLKSLLIRITCTQFGVNKAVTCILSKNNASVLAHLLGVYIRFFILKNTFNMRLPFTRMIIMGAALVTTTVACKKEKEGPAEAVPIYTTVSTLAGSDSWDFADGSGAMARFSGLEGAAVDAQGNVYVADMSNSRIRKVAPDGTVTTWAGSAPGLVNGPLATARFGDPSDVAIDSQGNLYVTDLSNHCIRKISVGGIVSTLAGAGGAGFADGPGATAKFNYPTGVAVDAQGNVYVTEDDGSRIRKVLPNGTVSTVAGTGQPGFADGPGNSAQFISPEGIAVDVQGTLYVAELGGNRIRKITANGTVSTLAGSSTHGAGDGTGSNAQFYGPRGVTIDSHGDLLVADAGNYCVRKVTPAGVVSTVAGTKKYGYADGPVGTAQFTPTSGIVAGSKGVFYVMEGTRLRKVVAQ